ncbi:MAG: hypothetical protein LBU65_09470 [Planctomycetaceae bacterium]|nr:hypothetical protein [Planctomycetaceae bacterium]
MAANGKEIAVILKRKNSTTCVRKRTHNILVVRVSDCRLRQEGDIMPTMLMRHGGKVYEGNFIKESEEAKDV